MDSLVSHIDIKHSVALLTFFLFSMQWTCSLLLQIAIAIAKNFVLKLPVVHPVQMIKQIDK